MKKLTIVICVMIVILLILMASAIWLFTILLKLPNARGLVVDQMWSTNDAKFPLVRNIGKGSVSFVGFYNENGTSLRMSDPDQQFWNGSCYVLPPEKFVTLILDGQLYYSKNIYVLFTDGCKVKIYG